MKPQATWSETRLFYVECEYHYGESDDFYRGPQPSGSGVHLSRFFSTRDEAKARKSEWEWKNGDRVCTGHVHSFVICKIKSIKLWARGTGKSRRFSQKKPVACNRPCAHCRVADTKGISLSQLMEKHGVSRGELLDAEQEEVDRRECRRLGISHSKEA